MECHCAGIVLSGWSLCKCITGGNTALRNILRVLKSNVFKWIALSWTKLQKGNFKADWKAVTTKNPILNPQKISLKMQLIYCLMILHSVFQNIIEEVISLKYTLLSDISGAAALQCSKTFSCQCKLMNWQGVLTQANNKLGKFHHDPLRFGRSPISHPKVGGHYDRVNNSNSF